MIALLPGGLQLAYDEAGSGMPLLLVHGWPHDRTMWAGQVAGLATYARVLAPDLRGVGESTVTGPYTIDQYADDLVAFLDSLGIASAMVCGLSMGGYIAFSTASARSSSRTRAPPPTPTRSARIARD